MYNNKNSSPYQRPIPLNGRSRPLAVMSETAGDMPTPKLDERMGNRGCDGNLRMQKPRPDTAGYGWGLLDHPLAMVYSPYQFFGDVYSPDVALSRGTLFAELDLPFEGDKKRMGGC